MFTVTCEDAYGSSVTDNFELYIDDNSPPYLTADSKNCFIFKVCPLQFHICFVKNST